MMISNQEVAKLLPIPPQLATEGQKNATLDATNTQLNRKISLKTLANKVLLRNQERNQHATPSKNGAQLCTEKSNVSCAPLSSGKQQLMEHVSVPKRPCKKVKPLPSPNALAWLKEHRQALDSAGWTRPELYRRNPPYKRGIAWLRLWDEAFPLAFLHVDGNIEFECSVHGRDFIQTARPRKKTLTDGVQQ